MARILCCALSAAAAPFAMVAPATTAAAADVAQINCPAESLTAAEQSVLAQSVREQTIAAHPVQGVLRRWIERCGAEHGWSPRAREAAFVHHISVIGAAEARRALLDFEVDVAALEREVLADTALINGARSGQFPRQELLDLLDRLDPRLRDRISGPAVAEDIARTAGTYVMFRALSEAAKLDFAAF